MFQRNSLLIVMVATDGATKTSQMYPSF